MKTFSFNGHQYPITGLLFNKDNDLLFSSSKDQFITLWSTIQLERVGTYKHGAAVYTMDIDKNSKYLISGDSIGKVYLWEACNGRLIKNLVENENDITSIRSVNLDYENNLLLIASGGRTAGSSNKIDIYKFEDLLKENKPQCLKSILIPNKDKITKARWCDLGDSILATSETGYIYKFNYNSGELEKKAKIHNKDIMDLDISPKEELILTASKDGQAKVIDPDTLNELSVLSPKNPERNINACRFSPLLSSNDEKSVKYHAFLAGGQESKDVTTTATKKGGFEILIYNYMHEYELGSLSGHFSPVNALAITSDGEILASGYEESSIRLYKLNNEEYNNLEKNK